MDTTQTIILTFIVNTIITGLVGGIVVYTLQKKIDATIQKSLFEHQIKFSRNYEKTVETLEGLYHKFLIFSDALNKMMRDTRDVIQEELVTEAHDFDFRKKDKEVIWGKLEDFWNYYLANRLFLPDSLHDEIWWVFYRAQLIHGIASSFLWMPDKRALIPAEWTDGLRKMLDLGADGEVDLSTTGSLLHELTLALGRQTGTLEKLYKSVAEAKH